MGAEEKRVVSVPQDATMDEIVALDIFRMKLDTLHQLGLAAHPMAYFARLDFIPAGGKPETHYLGRWGVMTTPSLTRCGGTGAPRWRTCIIPGRSAPCPMPRRMAR